MVPHNSGIVRSDFSKSIGVNPFNLSNLRSIPFFLVGEKPGLQFLFPENVHCAPSTLQKWEVLLAKTRSKKAICRVVLFYKVSNKSNFGKLY
jgi:hypothetical protein